MFSHSFATFCSSLWKLGTSGGDAGVAEWSLDAVLSAPNHLKHQAEVIEKLKASTSSSLLTDSFLSMVEPVDFFSSTLRGVVLASRLYFVEVEVVGAAILASCASPALLFLWSDPSPPSLWTLPCPHGSRDQHSSTAACWGWAPYRSRTFWACVEELDILWGQAWRSFQTRPQTCWLVFLQMTPSSRSPRDGGQVCHLVDPTQQSSFWNQKPFLSGWAEENSRCSIASLPSSTGACTT